MRILVVEDDTALREHLQQKLAESGFGVDVAADGEDGLFAGLNYPLDAAIVDLGLPRLSGLDVIKRLRARQRTFPIVILTARDSWQDSAHCRSRYCEACHARFRVRGREYETNYLQKI